MRKQDILIVDDEKEICFLLAAFLRQMGYNTDYAYSLKEGSEKISDKGGFDIVFLDLNLPDGLGYKLIPEIKQTNLDAQVVMISAHDSTLRRIKDETDDVDQYMSKPFSRDHIASVLLQLGS